jgi:hypothetical protein
MMDKTGSGRGTSLRHYPIIHMEGLMKTTKNFSHDSRPPGRDLNMGSPKYEAEMLATRPKSLLEHLVARTETM